MKTPGRTGKPGKWSPRYSSAAVTALTDWLKREDESYRVILTVFGNDADAAMARALAQTT